jgi:uncharacterized protein (DUF1501 family)
MSTPDPFTRREFLYSGLAMVSTLGSVPTFLSQAGSAMADTSMRTSSKAGVPEDRVLVVIQLSGGNDGLNTVIPYGADEYHKARPQLGLDAKQVLALNQSAGIGLHPSMKEIHELVGQEQANVVQGVGYPNPNRSHFASMDVWHTGDTRGGEHGWLGKALDQTRDANSSEMDIVAIDQQAPLATVGQQTRPVTFTNPHTLDWDPQHGNKHLRQAYQQMHQQNAASGGAGDPASFVHRTACNAQVASRQVRQAVGRKPKTKFPNSGLGRQLQKVAAMIADELPTRVYYVAMGGFDTHAGQAGKHENLLQQFSQAVDAFQRELKATGDHSRVVTMAFSEFGRRVNQNASGGTDHGTAGPLFLFGDHVRPGLLGQHPPMSNLRNNDLRHTVDFRCIYSSLLEQWLKLDSGPSLGGDFRQAKVLAPHVRA